MTGLRLLPLTIAACALLLAVKVAELGCAVWPGGLAVSAGVVTPAEASPAPTQPIAPPPSYKSQPPPATPAAAAPPAAPEPVITDAERQLLSDLRGRRQDLDARERTLSQRQGVLDAAEQRMASRVNELSALQTRLEHLDVERRAHDEANWTGLVKLYETMKPRDAAVIFNDMELPVMLQVVDRMKDAKAAAVLAAMQPDRARLLTVQLAAQRTRSVTLPPTAGGG